MSEREESTVEIVTPEEGVRQEGEDLLKFAELFANVFGSSTEQAIKKVNKKDMLENVAIFVDYDNVYWTLMNNYAYDPNNSDPSKNLFVKLWERYGQSHVRTFRAYADFEKVRTELTGLQKKRVQIRHVYSNGKDGDHRKNSSDIELCIDAIEHTYKDPGVSCYVFVTADSDMIPLISRMVYKNKRVELYYLSACAPKHVDITSFVEKSEDLLTFLNVEVIQYNLSDYILRALLYIQEWHKKYGRTGKFLGPGWLKGQFAKEFLISGIAASDLIEKLKVDGLIVETNKKTWDGSDKPSISLTSKGVTEADIATTDVASTKE